MRRPHPCPDSLQENTDVQPIHLDRAGGFDGDHRHRSADRYARPGRHRANRTPRRHRQTADGRGGAGVRRHRHRQAQGPRQARRQPQERPPAHGRSAPPCKKCRRLAGQVPCGSAPRRSGVRCRLPGEARRASSRPSATVRNHPAHPLWQLARL
ncbi:hypothetical protein AL037_10715 [Salipiger aestuarii]|nr:hypothetical protein AL037_10715 [Salipiger aestuarii]